MEIVDIVIDFIKANPRVVIGNAIGLVTTVLMFLSFQTRTPRMMLMYQCTISVTSITQFAVLGAWSGMALNAVCLVRNLIYFYKDKKIFSYKWWPYVMAILAGAAGMLSWQGPISLFIVLPIMIKTVILSLDNNNILRLVTIPLSSAVLIYDISFLAFLPSITEIAAIVSSIIGLIRYRKKKTKQE